SPMNLLVVLALGHVLAAGPGGRAAADEASSRAKELSSLRGFSPVCFSPDGRTLLLGRFNPGEESDAVLWDVARGREKDRFRWTGVGSATIGPDGWMTLVDDKGKLTLRDTATGRQRATPLRDLFFTWPVVFSPDGNLLAGNQAGVLKV